MLDEAEEELVVEVLLVVEVDAAEGTAQMAPILRAAVLERLTGIVENRADVVGSGLDARPPHSRGNVQGVLVGVVPSLRVVARLGLDGPGALLELVAQATQQDEPEDVRARIGRIECL